MSTDDNISMFDGSDPDMIAASQRARDTFKYFWRELSWEFRRIVPGLDVACVKIAFADGDTEREGPSHEHMWVNEVQFDGHHITGTLLNSPNWLTNLQEGDSITATLDDVSDWMFAVYGTAYGGFTINVIRSNMSAAERRAHDQAWGFDFGDPDHVRLAADTTPQPKQSFWKRLFGGKPKPSASPEVSPPVEHPMSLNMGEGLKKQLQATPEMLTHTDDRGWTLLHTEALAGNLTSVAILVEAGADPNLPANDGSTPLDLAEVLGWDHVIQFLKSHS